MKELFIVVDDNSGSPSDRISFAFEDKAEAEEYAKKETENSRWNDYHVEKIFLHGKTDSDK